MMVPRRIRPPQQTAGELHQLYEALLEDLRIQHELIRSWRARVREDADQHQQWYQVFLDLQEAYQHHQHVFLDLQQPLHEQRLQYHRLRLDDEAERQRLEAKRATLQGKQADSQYPSKM